ncbi:MAG TPA: 2-oxoglutarate dehydrogenase complex dihydrolipoyllysine-residue succinyltransferase [Vicinamibacterales bacterium]|nr:2-oxoglutarate dehydrogenase complex dihydrolipoyllysine-residue succinyltransferase [Vicinamibacterales bacterium]
MASNIVVPQLGESVVEARVARWLKKVGDTVAAGEPLVELETDKIDLEVGADQAGVLARIDRQAGEDVKVGELLAVVDASGNGASASTAAAPPPAPAAAPAPASAPAAAPAPAPTAAATPAPAATSADDVRATATARRVADQHGVDLGAIAGTGEGGRVTKEDVQRHVSASKPAASAPAVPQPAAPSAPAPAAARAPQPAPSPAAPVRRVLGDRTEERVRMSKRRATIAKRLVEAQQTAAMLTTFNEVDMTNVMALRERQKESFKTKYGIGLGIASFFVKASIAALREFPRLNAEIQGDEMVLKHYYDIGMAVGAPEGLVVPVLRDADTMSFAGIESAIRAFAAKAKDGSLTLEDLKGGTFSITNGGVFGSLMSTPILNPPQVGILGLHAIKERPVGMNGQIVLRPMMYTALTYDHRIVDGSEAVRFLVRVKELVEDPGALLLE